MGARVTVEYIEEYPGVTTLSHVIATEVVAEVKVEFSYGDEQNAQAALTRAYQRAIDDLTSMEV